MQYSLIGGIPSMYVSGMLLLIAWNLVWKGFALWYAAKRGQHWWFIAFLVVNTFGLLEIAYIFFIAKVPEFRSKLGLH